MTETIRGVDVAKWQGNVKWSEVKRSGVQFAIIKCSEGVGYTDPRFAQNWNSAKAAGLIVGAYHFARVSRSKTIEADARAEAMWFAKQVGPLTPGCLPLALDIEWDKRADGIKPAEIVRWCEVFCTTIEELTHRPPIIYTGYNFWQWKLAKSLALSRYPLWQVLYTTRAKISKPIPGWPAKIWQHSNSEKIPGISGGVDGNRFLGSFEELRQLAGLVDPNAGVTRIDPIVDSGEPARVTLAEAISVVNDAPASPPTLSLVQGGTAAVALLDKTPHLGIVGTIISALIERFAGTPKRSDT